MCGDCQRELPLKDDGDRRIVRVGDTVRRPAMPWTRGVHSLLDYLAARDFPYSPRALGFDDEGREVLSFVPGTSGADAWPHVVHETGLAEFAKLLRTYHDAIADFRPSPAVRWAVTSAGPRELVCHTDFAPWNIVWADDGKPVGIIDWDLACPGPRMDDVAWALLWSVPFRRDESAVTGWSCWTEPPNRRRRLEIFAEGYGLTSLDGIVDRVIDRVRLGTNHVRQLAGQGVEPQAGWIRGNVAEEDRLMALWIEEHRHLFE